MSAGDDKAAETIGESGLIDPGSRGIVLLSGGPDSVALLAGLVAFSPDPSPVALHLNYGLRAESGDDQAVCVDVCERLGVELVTIRAGEPERNLQGWARELRYSAAEKLREERDAEWIAVGHTRSDVAETVIYRLATSPGRRALAAMDERRGAVVRPLLGMSRSQTREYVAAAGLPFAEDASNLDPAFARVRIRTEVMPPLTEINPAAEINILRTRSELLEEGELLEELAADLLEESIREDGSVSFGNLGEAHPALRRLVLRQLAEGRLGRQVPVSRELSETVAGLALDPEGGTVDLGGGDSFRIESGRVAVTTNDEQDAPGPAALRMPGETVWNGWRISVERVDPPFAPTGAEAPTLDLEATGDRITVRGWRPGDRFQPLGMEGTKTLQDLFTDRRIERSRRRHIPVLMRDDEVIWVAGIALGHKFRLTPETKLAIRFEATPPETTSRPRTVSS